LFYKMRIEESKIKFDDDFDKDAKQNCPKIYVISKNKKIVYVGITNQSIIKRFNYGVNSFSKPKNGYSGYKWLKNNANYNLSICIFDLNRSKETDVYLEIIESEIAYLARNLDGQWPEYQNEIHFHESNESQRNIALDIMNKIKNKE